LAAQRAAREAEAGLWSACGGADRALQPPVSNRANCDAIRGTDYLSPEERQWFLARCITPGPPAEPGESCHPSYRGACLDPNASDYDCAGGSGNGPLYTVPVQVVGPDVFDLDWDGDGYGCE